MTFQKGHPGYKPKGAKAKTTLLKEERRRIFEAEMSQVFVKKIHAARPEYVLDQFLGKAPEKHEVTIKTGPTEEDKQLAERLQALERDNG